MTHPPTKNYIYLFGNYLFMWYPMWPVLYQALMTQLRTRKCLCPPGITSLVEERERQCASTQINQQYNSGGDKCQAE